MSLTKRELEKDFEKNSPAQCPNCRYEWNDKFYIYCAEHEREEREER